MLLLSRPFWPVPIVDKDRHVFPVAGHGNVSEVAVHGAGGGDVGLIDRCALGFVDRDRVAVVEAAEVLGVEVDETVFVAVESNGDLVIFGGHHGAQHTVFDAYVFVIARVDNAVSSCKSTFAGVRCEERFRRGIWI